MVLKKIKQLTLTNEETFNEYDKIVKNKKAPKYGILYGKKVDREIEHSALYKNVNQRYTYYYNNTDSLFNLTKGSYSSIEKESLLHCYNSSTNGLNELKTAIKRNQNKYFKVKCAYCGIGEISSMDHFAPKELYPEYSVHPLNLIPCCATCNSKKGEKFIENEELVFFNPYFNDEIKSLMLDIQTDETGQNFLLNIKVINTTYEKHLNELNIIKRYESEAESQLEDLIDDVLIDYDENKESYSSKDDFVKEQKKNIERKITNYKEKMGVNSVKVLVYEAFNSSNYFDIDFLQSLLG